MLLCKTLENVQQHLSTSIYFDHVQYHLELQPTDLWKVQWELHHKILQGIEKKDKRIVMMARPSVRTAYGRTACTLEQKWGGAGGEPSGSYPRHLSV